MKRRVLIVDQFSGITPYSLQQKPIAFDALIADLTAAALQSSLPSSYFMTRKPTVVEVEEDFVPEWATTVIAADKDGRAFVWRSRWDSSG